MKISDELTLAVRNLVRRPGRTALTVVGVVVGTCAVVLMISMGLAQSAAQDEMIAQWADLTKITVYRSGTTAIDDTTRETISQMEHVVACTPEVSGLDNAVIHAGRNDRYQGMTYDLYAYTADSLPLMGYELLSGGWLPAESTATEKGGKIAVLVGQNAAYQFEDTHRSQNSPKRRRWMTDDQGNPQDPFFDITKEKLTLTLSDGQENSANTRSWELVVVGVVKEDYAKGYWTSGGLVMRLEDYQMLQRVQRKLVKDTSKHTTEYNNLILKTDDVNNVESVEAAIQEMGFGSYSSASERENMRKQTLRGQLMLAGLAAVSLLVAALNIANTMTMAIYERTREIGVMKVLGCEIADIRTMFLIESGAIGFVGGVAGSVLGLGVGFVLNHLGDIMGLLGQSVDLSGLMGGGYYYMGMDSGTISLIPPWLILAALAFATCIGLLSGVAPANRAVKISALEAIRHD